MSHGYYCGFVKLFLHQLSPLHDEKVPHFVDFIHVVFTVMGHDIWQYATNYGNAAYNRRH